MDGYIAYIVFSRKKWEENMITFAFKLKLASIISILFPNNLFSFSGKFTNRNETERESLKIEIAHIVNSEKKQIMEFWLKPDRNIKIKSIEIESRSFSDQIKFEKDFELVNNNWHLFAAYKDVELGQKWDFIFSGMIEKSGRQFNKKISYTI